MENRYFQWIAGDRRGEVLVLNNIEEDDGIIYISFKDGSRINSELVAEINVRDLSGKMMAEVESPSNIWKFQEEKTYDDKPRIETDWESQTKYEVPSADEIAHADLTGTGGMIRPEKKMKKIELIPPRITSNKFGKVTNVVEQAPPPSKKKEDTNDPVWVMMNKAKKFNTRVPMELVISLPTKSLYDVAKESFDNGGEKVIDYIINNLDDTKLKESLKVALLTAYDDVRITSYTPEEIEAPIIGEAKAENK